MDIVAIGEVLIDLTQTGVNEAGVPLFAANPGGAPANLAVAAARLGASTALISKVGQDAFGRYLRSVLEENRVDTRALAVDEEQHTTLAVVSVDGKGERDFTFYRDPGADSMLLKDEIPPELLQQARILHFGSVSLTREPARTTTLSAARTARSLGALVTYDPNYRANLWPDEATAVRRMRKPLDMVDILKISDEELPLMADTADLETGTAALADRGIRLVLVTLGADGVYYRFGEETGSVPGVPCTVGDTNGAGDTFFGAFLARLCRRETGLDGLSRPELEEMLAYANRAASLTTSRRGAIPAMPTLDEMNAAE